MKKCFLIVDYSDTKEKKDILIELINDIKKHNYEIFLSSHINHNTDITSLVDYFYYDKENTLNYDYEFKINKTFRTEDFEIVYKSFHKFSTHGFTIQRILLQPLILLKSLGYDIIHKIEYDNTFKSWDFINEFEQKLKKYDIVGVKRFFDDHNTKKGIYTLSGEFISINLNKIEYKDFKYDYEEWKSDFKRSIDKYKSVIFEYVAYDKKYSKYNYFAYEKDFLDNVLNKNLITSVLDINSIYDNFCFIESGNKLQIFVDNTKGIKEEKLKFIFDGNKKKELNIKKGTWVLMPIDGNFTKVNIEISYKNLGNLDRNSDYIKKNIIKWK